MTFGIKACCTAVEMEEPKVGSAEEKRDDRAFEHAYVEHRDLDFDDFDYDDFDYDDFENRIFE